MNDEECRHDELLALASIYDESVFQAYSEEREGQFIAHLDHPKPFLVKTTASDKNAGTTITKELQHLPPIMLFFHLPLDYPSCSAPEFTLSCKWMTLTQLTALCRHLDDLWQDNSGSVVLYVWTSFLADDALTFLHITSPLNLDGIVAPTALKRSLLKLSHDNGERDKHCGLDPRCIQDIGMQASLLPALIEFDQGMCARVFARTLFTCQVCFLEKLGDACTQFESCAHVYCRDCMRGYFEVMIRDGNVQVLTCPSDKCDAEASPEQVKSLVSSELFARYDRLLLQNSLDRMTDIAYCPRRGCECPVVIDAATNMGACPRCDYVFCAFCKLAFHAVAPCRIKADDARKIREEYHNATPEGKRLLEQRYGRVSIQHVVQEADSLDWLHEFSKACPHCTTHIEKMDGCNKMQCSKCHSYFCWLCMAQLPRNNPYSHFSNADSVCYNKLFYGIEVNDPEADLDDDDYD